MTTTSSIRARNVSVSYGNHVAVREVDLEIEPGEIGALVGPSGCGKSTFLSAVNRLTDLVPGCRVEGEIRVGDNLSVLDPRTDVLLLRRRVGMVFQKPNPFPRSIRKNFAIPLREHGYAKDEIGDRIESALREAGLWTEVADRLDHSALALSGGQQQRLCIARALVLEPEIVLFDEPCSALDPLSSGVVEDLISSLRGTVTTMIVTHNLAQARRLADRVAVFWIREGSGTVVEAGEVAAIFGNPTDPDARRYLAGERG